MSGEPGGKNSKETRGATGNARRSQGVESECIGSMAPDALAVGGTDRMTGSALSPCKLSLKRRWWIPFPFRDCQDPENRKPAQLGHREVGARAGSIRQARFSCIY